MADGSARAAGEAKRTDALARRALAGEVLGRLGLVGDARAYHAWLPLPETWRAEAFVAAALRFGIALTPGSSFAAEQGHAPGGVRLALASPPLPVLRESLTLLARLVDGEVAAAETE
jgi:DNA-binding transcriptional MocR family regulator